MRVTKRDGSLQELDIDKIHAVLDWACNGGNDDALAKVRGVSLSEIEMKAHLNLHDKIKTSDIHECLVKAAADLINEDTPNYDHVAARLRWFAVRKVAFCDNLPPHLYHIVKQNTKAGVYDPDVMKMYSKDEWYEINDMIDHNRDDLFRYAGAEQMAKKYLAQNRKTKKVYETFQIPYIMVSAILFNKYPVETRLSYVKRYYDQVSQHYVSLPTPIMSGLRTRVKSFSSCVLVDVGDSLDSITTAATAIVDYASRKAGIGLNIGRLRAQGQPVRGGDAVTTGVLPFAKFFAAALKSCCLTPDTIVEILSVKQEKIKLSDLTAGMKIKTRDTVGNSVFREVTEVFKTEVPQADQVRLEFENGTIINGSINHPIMVMRSGSVVELLPLGLTKDDLVITDTGMTALKSCLVGQTNPTGYIDITVADTHTFFASDSLTKEMVLTHNSQGAVRGASATFNFMLWHYEFETLIELKNNKGTEETRLRTVDYCIHLNKTMYERLIADSHITFFSPDEVPDLYEAFYGDADAFKVLYEKYEHDKTKTKKQLPAREVFAKIATERYDTGRIYIMHADHVNTKTPFKEKIYMSNLCMEILLRTVPVTRNGEGEIALCTLSAINVGKLKPDTTEKVMAEACEMAVRGLDELLTYQDYPNVYAERNVLNYRPLGVGLIGFAHWLAKNALVWGKSSEAQVDKLMHSMAYNLIKTSVQLAKEKGACLKSTHYHDGVMPSDSPEFKALGEEAKKYGIRNAVLMAAMPSETSSQCSNETNGIEPPKSLVTVKGSKDGVMSQVVPGIVKYAHAYQTAWEVPVRDYLFTVSVMQRYMDQTLSANTSYNPHKTPVTTSILVGDLLEAYKLGIKTLYYNNTLDEAPEADEGCEGGACKI